jgi:hypothetical protein
MTRSGEDSKQAAVAEQRFKIAGNRWQDQATAKTFLEMGSSE